MRHLFLNLLKTPTCVGYLRLAVERNIAVVSNLVAPDGIVYYQPGQYCSNSVGRFPIFQDMEMVGIAWVCWCFPASIGCQICQQIQNSLFEDATISHDIARFYGMMPWLFIFFVSTESIKLNTPPKKTQTSPDVCDIFFFDLHLGTWWTSYNPCSLGSGRPFWRLCCWQCPKYETLRGAGPWLEDLHWKRWLSHSFL